MENIPGAAAAGFTYQTVNKLSYSCTFCACQGVTAEQVSPILFYFKFGQLQYNFSQVSNLTTAAFAGWTSGCVYELPSLAFSQVTAAQIANFSTSGASGKREANLVFLYIIYFYLLTF